MHIPFKSLAAVTVSALLLTGCVSNTPKPTPFFDRPYVSDRNISQANNVMRAAGIYQIRDARGIKGRAGVDTGQASLAELTLGTAVDAFADPASIGLDASGFMNVMFWLSRPKAPESSNYMIAWIAESEISDPLAAQESLRSKAVAALYDSFKHAKPGQYVPSPYLYRQPNRFTGEYSLNGVTFEGTNCSTPDRHRIDCYAGLEINEMNWDVGHAAKFRGFRKGAMPDFVPGKRGWIFKNYLVNKMFTMTGDVRAEIDLLSAWVATSEKMPDHVYFYLAPKKYTYRDANQVVKKGLVPLVINRGKILLFTTYKG